MTHGIDYGEGALITAEMSGKEMEGGFLMLMDGDGKELERFPTGGNRPHEIVDCGDRYAIAHYGNVQPEPGDPLVWAMNVQTPGVSSGC